MRQSFVDYLWNSRGGIPPLGFPYPLSWPKRPLPSLPGLTLGSPDLQFDAGDHHNDLLRPTQASAFTPVSSAAISSNPDDDRSEKQLDLSSCSSTSTISSSSAASAKMMETENLDDKQREREKVKHLSSKMIEDSNCGEKHDLSKVVSSTSSTSSGSGASSTLKCEYAEEKTTDDRINKLRPHFPYDLQNQHLKENDSLPSSSSAASEENNKATKLQVKGSLKLMNCDEKTGLGIDDRPTFGCDLEEGDSSSRDEEDIDVTDECLRSQSPNKVRLQYTNSNIYYIIIHL